jgi:hypothetical protein
MDDLKLTETELDILIHDPVRGVPQDVGDVKQPYPETSGIVCADHSGLHVGFGCGIMRFLPETIGTDE